MTPNSCYTGNVNQQFTVIHISVTGNNVFRCNCRARDLTLTRRASTGCALISGRAVEYLTCRRMKMIT